MKGQVTKCKNHKELPYCLWVHSHQEQLPCRQQKRQEGQRNTAAGMGQEADPHPLTGCGLQCPVSVPQAPGAPGPAGGING